MNDFHNFLPIFFVFIKRAIVAKWSKILRTFLIFSSILDSDRSLIHTGLLRETYEAKLPQEKEERRAASTTKTTVHTTTIVQRSSSLPRPKTQQQLEGAEGKEGDDDGGGGILGDWNVIGDSRGRV